MQVNDTILLDDNQKYTLLQETVYENEKYYLAIGLDENENPNYKNMLIFKECEDVDGIYVETVANESLIIKLTRIFEKKLNEEENK